MSKSKWITGLVSLLVIAVAPAALAEESGATSSEVQAPAALPATVDGASKDRDELQIQEVQAEIKKLRAEVAARLSDGREYLDQNLVWW